MEKPNKPVLYIVPSLIGTVSGTEAIAPQVKQAIAEAKLFFVENPKPARAFLKAAGRMPPYDDLVMEQVDKSTGQREIMTILADAQAEKAVLLSDAGSPGLADPGQLLVRECHRQGWRVKAMPGQSAIFYAMMASGLNGQRFCFHGYLPIDSAQRRKRLKELETDALKTGASQYFIETPYRNEGLLADMLATLKHDTLLHISAGLETEEELVATRAVGEWQKKLPLLKNIPAVFAIGV